MSPKNLIPILIYKDIVMYKDIKVEPRKVSYSIVLFFTIVQLKNDERLRMNTISKKISQNYQILFKNTYFSLKN